LLSGASGEFRQSFATPTEIAASGEVSRGNCAAISADVGAPLAGVGHEPLDQLGFDGHPHIVGRRRDLRWQMVLGCLAATEPLFSQGALFAFRERLIATNLDRRLLERTVERARETKAFDPEKLPKTLRVAMDSSPLEGAGRVECTAISSPAM
jgi:hypothetical protein